jgi:hypothetical protein
MESADRMLEAREVVTSANIETMQTAVPEEVVNSKK